MTMTGEAQSLHMVLQTKDRTSWLRTYCGNRRGG